MKNAILAIFAMAICCPSLAVAVEAKIDGPTERPAGKLVILNTNATQDADVTRWIIPTSLPEDIDVVTTGGKLFFASPNAGKYTFGLIAAAASDDPATKIDIDVTTHTVTIVGNCVDKPDPIAPPPVDPVDPDPEPQPGDDFGQLRELSESAARQLNDPATASALAAALSAVSGESVEEMQSKAQLSVEAVLLNRKGESRNKDWLTVWRKPVNSAIKGETPSSYSAELKAVSEGLIQSTQDGVQQPAPKPPPAATGKVRVVVQSRDNCSFCNTWMQKVCPVLKSWGMQVDVQHSSGKVPSFIVFGKDGSQLASMIGYHDADQFRAFVH